MNKKILCVDFSIFGNQYLQNIEIEEFDYWLRDSYIDFPFDFFFYRDLTTYLFTLIKNLDSSKIHFLYRQEDIIKYLDGNIDLYNIDFYSDTDSYYYLVDNKSWVRYALDKKLIDDYKWVYSIEQENEYAFSSINNLNLSLLDDVEELYITLSPETLPSKYHNLFYELINICNNLLDKEFNIEERLWDWNVFNQKENTKCFSTLLNNEQDLDKILQLNYSLLKSNTQYPLLVLVSNLLDERILNTLVLYGIKYQLIKDLREDLWNIDLRKSCSHNDINKLYTYIIPYEKTIFIDCNLLVIKNIDDLFDCDNEDIITKDELLQKEIFIVDKQKDIPQEKFKTYRFNTPYIEDNLFSKNKLKDVLNYIDVVYQVNNLIKENNNNGTKTG